MARVRLTSGRGNRSAVAPVAARAAAGGDFLAAAGIDASLTAAADPPLLTTYEWTQGCAADRLFARAVLDGGFAEMGSASWPSEVESIVEFDVAPVFQDGNEALYRLDDGSLVLFSVGWGWARVRVAGNSRDDLQAYMAAFQGLYPPSFLSATPDRVPITFWSLSRNGPVSRLRMIDSSSWAGVEDNYPQETRAQIAELMDGFRPGETGQLILWQGPPGTGKTWALRALASEWLPWAEFHYITDPDVFFVDSPTYMVDVLLAETYDVLAEDGKIYGETDPEGKWRVLILEDTGELLSANAKEKYGQGLSRLLNVVDGMIGQGLRVLCLVTTNDELGELNAAVKRPGRCAAQIVFPPFPASEASAWLGEDVDGEMTVAEMYARRGSAVDALEDVEEEPLVASLRVEFAKPISPSDLIPIPGTDVSVRRADLDRVVALAQEDPVVSAIRQVAEGHQDEATGYGDTAWSADTRTVLYVAGDWTDTDPIEEDFLAIDGVDSFVWEAEGMPDGWCDAEVVYGTDPFGCGEEAALARLVEFASQPLEID